MLLVANPEAQTHLYTHYGDKAGQWFGGSVAIVGDTDRDGFDDYATTSEWYPPSASGGDAVRLYSGRDGHLIGKVPLPGPGSATSVSGLGDMDSDGHADFGILINTTVLIGYQFHSGKTMQMIAKGSWPLSLQNGKIRPIADLDHDNIPDVIISSSEYSNSDRVVIVSGKSGKIILDLKPGGLNYTYFGHSVSRAGDVNGDGIEDFLVGDPLFGSNPTYNFYGPGRAWLFSGANGGVIYTFWDTTYKLPSPSPGFGSSVCGCGDLDGDKVPDLAIGCPGFDGNGTDAGAVFIYSGKTGNLYRTLHGPVAGSYLGWSGANVGDWNRDGYPDLACGGQTFLPGNQAAGVVRVISGKDGKEFATIVDDKVDMGLGSCLNADGDIDGDGVRDLVAGLSPASWASNNLWYFKCYSGAGRSLWSDTHRVSVAAQDMQVLTLEAGAGQAGNPYLVLGSLAGINPGLQLGTHLLPLNLDPYLVWTATVPNSPFLQGSLGLLDAKGTAKIQFVAGAGFPAGLAGLRMDHAAVVFGNTGIATVSDWVPLLLEK
ncbi:MAG: integrin alpha [Planctomycetota bacterium]